MHLHLAAAPRIVLPDGSTRELAALDGALLAWLALEGPTPRARLAALLWPASDAEAARNSLRQRLFKLKRQLAVDLVDGQATLALVTGVTHDLDDADTVLVEVDEAFGTEFAQWLERQRTRRQQRVRQSLVELAGMAEGARDWDDALAHAAELLALEPLSEDAHRRMMRLHYLRGDRSAALLAFDACERMLKDEVGARPSADTLALLATVEAAHGAGAPHAGAPVPASVLRPPRLVGRDRELAALVHGWQAGQVVALVGEAGIGKSRLFDEFAAARPGVVVAAGRPGDAGVPFATLARLLRAVGDRTERPDAARQAGNAAAPARHELARVLPEFDTVLPRHAEAGRRLVLRRALAEWLSAQSSLRGLVVDDLHFADEASLEMIGALVDEPGDTVRWGLAYRPAEAGSPLSALHDGLAEQARLAPVVLAPLDEPRLAELVDSLGLPGVSGGALATGLRQRTGGNPLFVLETLKQAWVEQALGELADPQRLPRPVTVGRLIERRIAQLSPGALALARAAAVAGVDFGIGLAEHVLGVSALQFTDALVELEAANVLHGTSFAHDLVFDAVRASVPEAIALHLHARIAGWLEVQGGEPARVARHWIDAGQAVRSLPWLARAAEAASAALRPKEFVAFMETKAAIEADSGDRAAAFESLRAATDTMRATEMQLERGLSWCDRLDALADTPAQRVRAGLERGLLHTWVRDPARGIVVLQQALAEFERERIDDEALAARVHHALGSACQQGDRTQDALVHLRAALGWVDRHGSPHARGEVHGDLACVLDNLGRLDEALTHHGIAVERMRDDGDVANWVTGLANLSINRMDAGDLLAADAALAQAQRLLASHEGFDGLTVQTQFLRMLVLAHLGRYRDALAQGEFCVESARRFQPALLARVRLRVAQCWWHLGQWARIGQVLDAGAPDEQGDILQLAIHARLRRAQAAAQGQARAPSGPGAEAAAVLRRLHERLAAADERPDLRLLLRIELAADAEPAAAWRELAAVAVDARRIGHLGVARAAHVRAAAACLELGDAACARDEALAALALAADGRCDVVLLPAELWLHAGRALAAAADPLTAGVIEQGRRWLLDTAANEVPEPFRDGFLQRNPVNRELLALAARHPPASGGC